MLSFNNANLKNRMSIYNPDGHNVITESAQGN
jgi:hypothetical protein